jgi:hypothetical protein
MPVDLRCKSRPCLPTSKTVELQTGDDMMKTLIYCHRNWNDSAQEWEERQKLCREVSRELGLIHPVEAEDFATLQRLCLREGYQRVILPSAMHTPPEVILWLKSHRIRIHDAMRLQVQSG